MAGLAFVAMTRNVTASNESSEGQHEYQQLQGLVSTCTGRSSRSQASHLAYLCPNWTPMDGGRVFRAVLTMVSNQRRATVIASSIGKFMAVVFAVVVLFIVPNPILVLVGVFVFVAASAEDRLSELQAQTRNLRVEDAMTDRAIAIDRDATTCEAFHLMLQSGQWDLPVVSDSTYVGMVRRQDVVSALRQSADGSSVREIIQSTPPVQLNADLWDVAVALQHPATSTIAVVDGEDFVGIVTRSNIRLVVEAGASPDAPITDRPPTLESRTGRHAHQTASI